MHNDTIAELIAINAPRKAIELLDASLDRRSLLEDLKLRVRAHITSHDHESARRLVPRLRSAARLDGEGWRLTGFQSLSDGRLTTAMHDLCAAAILEPADAANLAALATAHRVLGDPGRARVFATRARHADATSAEAHNAGAALDYAARHFDPAARNTMRALTLKPGGPRLYTLLHRVTRQPAARELGAKALGRAQLIDPLEESNYIESVAVTVRRGETGAALAAWRRHLLLRPDLRRGYELIQAVPDWLHRLDRPHGFVAWLTAFGQDRSRFYIDQVRRLVEQSEFAAAIRLLEDCIRTARLDNPDIRFSLALTHYKKNDLETAVDLARKLVQKYPDDNRGWVLATRALDEQGFEEKALRVIRNGVRRLKRDGPIWAAYGDLMTKREKYGRAIKAYGRALFNDPREPGHYARLSNVYDIAGKEQRSAQIFDYGLRLRSESHATVIAGANRLVQTGQIEIGLAKAKQAYVMDPNAYASVDCVTQALLVGDQAGAAHTIARRYCQQYPNFPAALSMFAVTMARAGEPKRAFAVLHDALIRFPGSTTLMKSYSVVAVLAGEAARGRRFQRSLATLRPGNAGAQSGFGMTELWHGNWPLGFDLYERGFEQVRRGRGPTRHFRQKRWQGEALSDSSIVIHCEQGIGDELMFASALNDILAHAAKVHIEATPRLVPLFRRSFPTATVYSIEDRREWEEKGEEIDYFVPAGSLMRYTRRTTAAFGRNRPYLEADPQAARTLRRRYREDGDARPVIGIGWRGGSIALRQMKRSFELDTMRPIFTDDRFIFVSVQYGEVAGEIARANDEHGAAIIHDAEVDPLKNMDLSAAQIMACDLIISASNAGVHTAGALGVPCWNLIPLESDWRWTWGRSDVLWYPGMRLYRQSCWQEWDDVIENIVRDLDACYQGERLIGTRHTPDPTLDWVGEGRAG